MLPEASFRKLLLRREVRIIPTDVAFITFRFNMNKQITDGNFNPDADFIDVAGTFNDWLGDDQVYDGNNDGIYQYTAFGFTTGETIEYKARINANWEYR